MVDTLSSSKNIPVEDVTKTMKLQVPVKRFGKPEETAKAIAFLASPAAGYINGVSLAVDGGRLTCI